MVKLNIFKTMKKSSQSKKTATKKNGLARSIPVKVTKSSVRAKTATKKAPSSAKVETFPSQTANISAGVTIPSTQQEISPQKTEEIISTPVSQTQTSPYKKFDESNSFYHILNQVVDPELGVGIADMGIIYDVQQKGTLVEVTMTLTSMGCPAGPEITTDVDAILRLQDGVEDVHINVVWEPAWTPDMMKPELKAMLFGG